MSIDYYRVLGLKRTCSQIDVLNAFQKIVYEFGMEKLNDDETKNRLVAFEAYDVLNDQFWRGLYDQFGNAIKIGIYIQDKQNMRRYSYHGDIFLTYKSVYGSTNPFTHIMSRLSDMKATPSNSIKPIVRKMSINLTLNEVFFGTLKKISILQNDGTQHIANIKISKGLPVNSEIIHKCTDGSIVVFSTNDLPHERFVRNGQDLISYYNVTFKEIMSGVQFVIKTLDHKQLRVNITQMITPTYQKIIHGEGMPGYGENCHNRGNIVLKFNIIMPKTLSLTDKDLVYEALSKTNMY